VLLVEQGDLASATSSASSKLVHGGLRYLEQYEFRSSGRVGRSAKCLLAAAPQSSGPCALSCRFTVIAAAWVLRGGLFLYDHIGGRKVFAAAYRTPGADRIAAAP